MYKRKFEYVEEYYKRSLLSSNLYLCCQPGYYSYGLDYREIYVTPKSYLYGTVSMYYELKLIDPDTSLFVIPDGCIDIVLSFKEGVCEKICVCGTISSIYSMEIEDCDYIFGMRFLPGKFPLNIMDDIEEHLDSQETIKNLSAEDKFLWQMTVSNDFLEKIRIANEYIINKCGPVQYKEKMVEYAMDCIYKSNGNISIKALSKELVYSQRYIERVFKEYTGFSPKNMCKIVRAHKAALMLLWEKDKSRTEISMDCGYADLSHMNRELKKVMGRDVFTKESFYRGKRPKLDIVYKF